MQYTAEGRSANALQRVVFIVQYTNEFSEQDFEGFDKESKSWREELPRRSVSNAVLFQPGSHRISFEEEKIAGLSYEALMKDGTVEFGLRFEENRILFLAGKYTRWNEIWPLAKTHLERATSLVPETNKTSSYASEYTDLFRATGNYTDFSPAGFLRKNSKFIPDHIFERCENFHFHTGYFESVDSPGPHRILTRINADLRDNDDEKSRDLSIVLLHKVMSQREPWVGDIELPDSVLSRGLDNFEVLHSLDKAVLGEILNDDMSKSIGLIE